MSSNSTALELAPLAAMPKLPLEMIHEILLQCVKACLFEKNTILNMRLVSKDFNAYLAPFALNTIQLEFTRFLRLKQTPRLQDLGGFNEHCRSLYCDLMIVRDNDEIGRLKDVFTSVMERVPEMRDLIDRLDDFCMNEKTFDGDDVQETLAAVLKACPRMERLKLSLPFQVIGIATSTATQLLARIFQSLAQRLEDPEDESLPLRALVIEHVSDSTILEICNNHIDLLNTIKVMRSLQSLVLSIKRQEFGPRGLQFSQRFWFLLGKCTKLENLCIVGWLTRRDYAKTRVFEAAHADWDNRSLPSLGINNEANFRLLRCLELRRMDVDAHAFLRLMRKLSPSLKELYLIEVYITNSTRVEDRQPLWVGGDTEPSGDARVTWIAWEMRKMIDLQLDVLRATGLGYDLYAREPRGRLPRCDVPVNREDLGAFDRKFVVIALGLSLKEAANLERQDWDAETYLQRRNPTSQWKRCIDGWFYNQNERALKELQKIIAVADRGMQLLTTEISNIGSISIYPGRMTN